MSLRKVIANVVGLAGCAAVAWGVHGLMLTGSCGGDGAPPCPPESTPYFVAMAVGMPVAIIAAVVGGRLAFLGLFLAVVAGSLWAGLELPADEREVPLLIGAIFAAVVLLPVLLVPFALLKKRRATRLVTQGATGIGTVADIRDTGVTVNNNPRVTLKLRIEPEDGSPPFDGEKTITVSRVELPYQGQRFPIWYDRADRGKFVLGTKVEPGAPPQVRRLFALAEAKDPGRPADRAAGAPGRADPLDRLAKLNELRLAGALTEAEFEAQKARILSTE